MNKSFRSVVIAILATLLLVFCWQLYWLNGLFLSMEEEIKRDIFTCMETADQLELLYRIDQTKKDLKKKNAEMLISISGELDEEGMMTFMQEDHYINKNLGTPDTTVNVLPLGNKEMADVMNLFVHHISSSLHEVVDKEIPVRINELGSLLSSKLKERNIQAKLFYIDLYDVKKDSVLLSSRPDSASVLSKDEPTLNYSFGANNVFVYRVYMESLTSTIVTRMSGILITTFLIILILSFAFWYLIRTVLNQKTLEEMKDDLTNNMTHELKTPIAVAYSATDALLDFDLAKDEEKRHKYLLICKEQLNRLNHLVEQILSMSMEQRTSFKLHPEKIRVREMLNELIEQHQLKANKPVVFTTNYQTDDPIVNADRTHLNNILSNLIDNAIKYSEEEARVTIEVSQRDGICRFRVTDRGTGIPADKHPYIFDKFYRVPRGNLYITKGYGLGLYYVKIMAEKHGGSVSVKSAPDQGSTFTVQIPINQEKG